MLKRIRDRIRLQMSEEQFGLDVRKRKNCEMFMSWQTIGKLNCLVLNSGRILPNTVGAGSLVAKVTWLNTVDFWFRYIRETKQHLQKPRKSPHVMEKNKGKEVNLFLLNTPKKDKDSFSFMNIFRTNIRSVLSTFLGQLSVRMYQYF